MQIAETLGDLDESVFRALNHAGSNLALDALMVGLAILGMTYVLVFAGPALWRMKRRELGFNVVVLLIVSDLVVEGFKLLFERERPMAVLSDVNTLSWGPFTTATSYSFPSGHACRVFAMGTLIALRTRNWAGVSFLGIAALISLGRIYLGLHWPSDVLAGALLGVLMALLMRRIGDGDNVYTRARASAVSWLRTLGRQHPPDEAKVLD